MARLGTAWIVNKYGRSLVAQARGGIPFVLHTEKTDDDLILVSFRKGVGTISGIDAFEAGGEEPTLSCTCPKRGRCHHPLTGLWQQALDNEGLSSDEWWEAEKLRRSQKQMEVEARRQEINERQEREVRERESSTAALHRSRMASTLRDRLLAPDHSESEADQPVTFVLDTDRFTISPKIDGRYLYGRSGGRSADRLDLYRSSDDPVVAALRSLISEVDDRGRIVHRLFVASGSAVVRMLATSGIGFLSDGTPLTLGGTTPAKLRWRIDGDGGQHATLVTEAMGVVIHSDPPLVVFEDGRVCGMDADVPIHLVRRLQSENPVMPDESRLLNEALRGHVPDECLPRTLVVEDRHSVPTAVAQLDEMIEDGVLRQKVRLRARYQWGDVDPSSNVAGPVVLEDDVLVRHRRNREAEEAMIRRLDEVGEPDLDRSEGVDRIVDLGDDVASYRFKRDVLPVIEADPEWAVTRSPDWTSDLIPWTGAELSVEVTRTPMDGVFDVGIRATLAGSFPDIFGVVAGIAASIPADATDTEAEEIIRGSVMEPEHPVRIGSEGVAMMPSDLLVRLAVVLWRIIDASDEGTHARVHRLALSDLADLHESIPFDAEPRIRSMLDMLAGRSVATPTPKPTSFSPHESVDVAQQAGLDWMQSLLRAGFGGILADEVGVGKTLQILLHAAAMKDTGDLEDKALIIVPKSAIDNWDEEAERFVPGLRRIVWEGSSRHGLEHALEYADLVLTTYSCATDDRIAGRRWSVIAIDEAQDLRNEKTNWTQAVMRMEADQKIPASGTPIENSLDDAWTLSQIANPGMLGSRTHFKSAVKTPIEQHQDAVVQRRFARFMKPFVLRRTRKEAGHEVPDPVHVEREIEVGDAQAALYETIRLSTQNAVDDILRDKGIRRGKGQILTALLRMRQVCCHPELVHGRDADADPVASAKTEAIVADALELASRGERALVFSSWSGHLNMLRRDLDVAGLRTGQIDGSMSRRLRNAALQQFKTGGTDVLLITVKTGGRSLNIPEADAVMLADPWWNPQPERQAIGRTQRRGQTKTIRILRYTIARSIETRIVQIQDRKLKIAGAMHLPEGDLACGWAITEEDIRAFLAPLDAAAEPSETGRGPVAYEGPPPATSSGERRSHHESALYGIDGGRLDPEAPLPSEDPVPDWRGRKPAPTIATSTSETKSDADFDPRDGSVVWTPPERDVLLFLPTLDPIRRKVAATILATVQQDRWNAFEWTDTYAGKSTWRETDRENSAGSRQTLTPNQMAIAEDMGLVEADELGLRIHSDFARSLRTAIANSGCWPHDMLQFDMSSPFRRLLGFPIPEGCGLGDGRRGVIEFTDHGSVIYDVDISEYSWDRGNIDALLAMGPKDLRRAERVRRIGDRLFPLVSAEDGHPLHDVVLGGSFFNTSIGSKDMDLGMFPTEFARMLTADSVLAEDTERYIRAMLSMMRPDRFPKLSRPEGWWRDPKLAKALARKAAKATRSKA